MSVNKLPTFDLLNRMSELVSNARSIPLSGKIMLEKEEFSSLMRRLQDSVPVDLQQARQLLETEEKILSDSRRQAEDTTREATEKANAMLEDATNKANAMLADAQARANALVADAQARAQQMVSDSEIVARAQAEAQEMLEGAHMECEAYTAQVQATVQQLMENADAALSQQLDSLRAMRQDLTLGP